MKLKPEIMFRFAAPFMLLGLVACSGSASSDNSYAPISVKPVAITAANPADSTVLGLVPVSAGLF